MTFTMAHENYNVKNLEASIAFYEKALGLHEVRRKEASDGSFILVYMANENSSFELELTWLRDHLQALRPQYPLLADLRGKGLMLGLEVAEAPGKPLPDLAASLTSASEEEGLLLLRCGPDGQIIRWLPPLVVSEAEIDHAVQCFSRALKRVLP